MKLKLSLLYILFACTYLQAGCSLDHLLIGCNPDGDPNTADDTKLFLDCTEKYRNSSANCYYPMGDMTWFGDYRLGQPGFDRISGDPNKVIVKPADIVIECVDISSDLVVMWGSNVVIDEAGDEIMYSDLGGGHLHLTWRVSEAGASQMQWITFRIVDRLGNYQTSDSCSIAFCQPPGPGDICLDGKVDILDLTELTEYWLVDQAAKINDYYERADINHDGVVALGDFAILAEFWLN